MNKLNQQLPPTSDYSSLQQNFTTRQQVREQISLLNKENKTIQNLLAVVELNRTTVVDQIRGNQAQKDHYQSHREFGRELSTNNHNGSILNAKIINTTTNQGGNNITIFKNFIQQYNSHSNNNPKNQVNGNNTQVNNISKLDLNHVNNNISQNYPSQRGNHSSVVVADDNRAQSSQAIKTFDAGSRNQSTQGNYSIRENKIEPLRRKLTSNFTNNSNTRRNGGELIKLGQKLTQMQKGQEDEKQHHNTSTNNHNATSNSGMAPTNKMGNPGSIISRAAAAQQILQQKASQNLASMTMNLINPNSSRQHSSNNYNTQSAAYQTQIQSLQSSQINNKLVNNQKIPLNIHQHEDKENKREFSNRQNIPGTSQSAINILKRSKTADPSKAPLRQKESKVVEQPQQQIQQQTVSTQQQTQVATIEPQEVKQFKISQEKMEQVAQIVEERRKERMKTLTRHLEVCDLLDMRNPQSVAEFAPQIYKHMHQEELNHLYDSNFMENQSEVTEKMRAYLIDWISELHQKFKLWPETLYVCVGIIDKYLTLESDFKKKDLQCLGITALHISGKYEEIYPSELKHILRVTDNAVTKDQVLKLENKILQTLDFNVTFPSILRFMERYARIAQINEKTQMLAQYFCDTCLLDCTLMKEKPSKLAAISIYAAQRVMKGNQATVWNATLTKNTNYKEDEVKGMAVDLLQFIKNVEQSSLQSLYKKYSLPKFLEVTKLLE